LPSKGCILSLCEPGSRPRSSARAPQYVLAVPRCRIRLAVATGNTWNTIQSRLVCVGCVVWRVTLACNGAATAGRWQPAGPVARRRAPWIAGSQPDRSKKTTLACLSILVMLACQVIIGRLETLVSIVFRALDAMWMSRRRQHPRHQRAVASATGVTWSARSLGASSALQCRTGASRLRVRGIATGSPG
jgi:hypothetical protein